MKRLIFLLPILAFLFAGCGETIYDVIVKNDSSNTVTYSYNGATHTLASSSSDRFDVKGYTPTPTITEVTSGPKKSVKMVYDSHGDGDYTIEDADQISLTVTNDSGIAVTLKAGEYMTPLALPSSSPVTTSIYTSSPVFTTPPYALTVSYTTSGGSMTATINAP